MLSQTRRALEDFDNQHDFERMAADILNALGYDAVEPMAPAGGADGGRDIQFREGETPGIGFVTLDKNIRDKFKRDLAKQQDTEGVIALFCKANVTPAAKLSMAKEAIAKGFRIEIFDLERLRSLLDNSAKDIRRRYLGIDDELAAQLRSEVKRLLRFPDAVQENVAPNTLLETILADQLPRRAFDLLMRFDENDISEVPVIGAALHNHFTSYYEFREGVLRTEASVQSKIGAMVGVRFAEAWRIYLRYVMMRFGGASKETIIGWGEFLNYGITWDSTETVFEKLSSDPDLSSEIERLFLSYQGMSRSLDELRKQQ